jgi:hypothetical protein
LYVNYCKNQKSTKCSTLGVVDHGELWLKLEELGINESSNQMCTSAQRSSNQHESSSGGKGAKYREKEKESVLRWLAHKEEKIEIGAEIQ